MELLQGLELPQLEAHREAISLSLSLYLHWRADPPDSDLERRGTFLTWEEIQLSLPEAGSRRVRSRPVKEEPSSVCVRSDEPPFICLSPCLSGLLFFLFL